MTRGKTSPQLSGPMEEKDDVVPRHDPQPDNPQFGSASLGRVSGRGGGGSLRRRRWRRAACTALSVAGTALLLAACSATPGSTSAAAGTSAPCPDLLPPSGGACADTLGITAGDIAFLDNEEVRLNAMLRQDAKDAGDGYIDTYAPSEGHDACAAPASRWIEPLIPDAPAAPLHPNAVGERGMADAIVGAIKAA